MTSSQDDRRPDAAPAVDDQSLVEHSYPMSSYPAFPGKQVALSVAAALFLVTMFLPWWDAEIPLDRVADTLNGWLLFATGLSVGSLGANTGYSWVGNALFGLVPTLPVLVLVLLLVLRVLRLYVSPASNLFVYSLICAFGSLWTLLYGLLRINASNGVYPVMAGPWIILILSLVLCTMCILWWRTERVHFPKRRWSRIGTAATSADEPPTTDTDELFAGIDDNDESENEQLSFGRGISELGGDLDGVVPRDESLTSDRTDGAPVDANPAGSDVGDGRPTTDETADRDSDRGGR